MKKKHILTLVGVAFSLPLAQAASLVLNLSSDVTFTGGQDEDEDGSGAGFTFSNTGDNAPVSFGFGRQGAADFGPFILTDGTTTQSFESLEFVLSSTTNQGGTAIQRGGVGAVGILGGGNNTLIDPNENLTIGAVILGPTSDGSPALFAFEGFSTVFFNNTTAGESVAVNGTTVIATAEATGADPLDNADVLTADFAEGSEPTTVSIIGVSGGVSLGGVQAEFSVIPEPSSVLLLGLSGLALLRRRR